MTRKDYILLASACLEARTMAKHSTSNDPAINRIQTDAISRTHYRVEYHLADVLAVDNPNFNRALFLQACEGQVALTARKALFTVEG